MERSLFTIRPYRRADRQAVRDICVATSWMGQYRPELIGDDWLWAEYWTRYFTDVEPRHSWVVEQACQAGRGAVVGYLTGTTDQHRAAGYALRLLPGIVAHVIRRRRMRSARFRAAAGSMVRSLLAGEMALPPGLAARFPATWHFNLLAEGRGRGLGRRLFETFLQDMRSAGAGGVHAQSLSINAPVSRFCRAAGFRLVTSTPLHAFAHACPEPIRLLTWTLPLPIA